MKKTLVVVNNYNLREAFESSGAESTSGHMVPRHATWALRELEEAGFRVVLASDVSLPRWLNTPLVRLAITATRLVRLRRAADVFYCLSFYEAVLASWMIYLIGPRRVPVYGIIHGRNWILNSSILGRHILRFAACWICLTREATGKLRSCGLPTRQIQWSSYGECELAPLPRRVLVNKPFLLTVGKAQRDWRGLDRWAEWSPVPVVAILPHEAPEMCSKNITAVRPSTPGEHAVSTLELHELYAACSAIILPVLPTSDLSGLTVIAESLAYDVPVIMTETPGTQALQDSYPASPLEVVDPDARDDFISAVWRAVDHVKVLPGRNLDTGQPPVWVGEIVDLLKYGPGEDV